MIDVGAGGRSRARVAGLDSTLTSRGGRSACGTGCLGRKRRPLCRDVRADGDGGVASLRRSQDFIPVIFACLRPGGDSCGWDGIPPARASITPTLTARSRPRNCSTGPLVTFERYRCHHGRLPGFVSTWSDSRPTMGECSSTRWVGRSPRPATRGSSNGFETSSGRRAR